MNQSLEAIKQCMEVVARLRDPQKGCAWDLKQTHDSIAQNSLEEAFELVDAIENNDTDHMCEELGDLLLQVLLHAQIAKEQGTFSVKDVADRLSEKLIRRHPHVFGDAPTPPHETCAKRILSQWHTIKKHENKGKTQNKNHHGIPWKVAEKLTQKSNHSKELKESLADLESMVREVHNIRLTDKKQATHLLGTFLVTLVHVFKLFDLDFHAVFKDANQRLSEQNNKT